MQVQDTLYLHFFLFFINNSLIINTLKASSLVTLTVFHCLEGQPRQYRILPYSFFIVNINSIVLLIALLRSDPSAVEYLFFCGLVYEINNHDPEITLFGFKNHYRLV